MQTKTEMWSGHSIRFVEQNNEWWAVAKDIADALGYKETTQMTRHLNDKYLNTVKLTGVKSKVIILSEQGIYKAVLRSQRPEAEQFEDWIFSVIKNLRESIGATVLEMLSPESQKMAMERLKNGIKDVEPKHYIKANIIANKAVSTKFGHPKMIKKDQMTMDMLVARQPILDDTVELMEVNDRFNLGLSVSEKIYGKYVQ